MRAIPLALRALAAIRSWLIWAAGEPLAGLALALDGVDQLATPSRASANAYQLLARRAAVPERGRPSE